MTTARRLFQIRGHLQTLIALRLIEPADERFFLVLQKALARSPEFFRQAPVVLDAGPVAGRPPLNLAEFARRLRQQHLIPVGLQNGDEAWNRMAVNAGLALIQAGRPTQLPAPEPRQEQGRRTGGGAASQRHARGQRAGAGRAAGLRRGRRPDRARPGEPRAPR